jgi:hypothetical protein
MTGHFSQLPSLLRCFDGGIIRLCKSVQQNGHLRRLRANGHCRRRWPIAAARSHGGSVHTSGAQSGDVVLVTSEAILTAVLEGRLSVQAALDREVMVIDGPSGAADTIRQLLTNGLGDQSLGSPTERVRLFGPKR